MRTRRRRRSGRVRARALARAVAAAGLVPARERRRASAATGARHALAPAVARARPARPAQPGEQRRGDARLRRPHRCHRLRSRRCAPAPARAGAWRRRLARSHVGADRGHRPFAVVALRAGARARRHAGPRRRRLDHAARRRPDPSDRDLGLPRRAGGGRGRVAGVRGLVAVADAGARAAAHACRGAGGVRWCAGLCRRGRVRAADDAHGADDRAGGAGAAAAPRATRRRCALACVAGDAAGRSAVGAGTGLLVELRRRRLVAVVPAGRGRARLARAASRLLRRAGGRHGRPAAAHGGAVRAGLAGRPGREHRGDPVVEPGGRPARVGGHRARGGARGRGRVGMAPGRVDVRPAVAGLRVDRAQPARAVVAAGAGMVRGAARARGCRLAAAAARRARQAARRAAVASAAVAATAPAAARRSRRDGDRRGAGPVGARAHRLARLAVRHGSRTPGWIRCGRRRRRPGIAGAGGARPRRDRAEPRRQRPRRRLSLGRAGVPATHVLVARRHAGRPPRAARKRARAARGGLPRRHHVAMGRGGIPLPPSTAVVPVPRQRVQLRAAGAGTQRRDAVAARRHRGRRRARPGAQRARGAAGRRRAGGAPRQPRLVGSGVRRGGARAAGGQATREQAADGPAPGVGLGRRAQPLRPSRSRRGRALAPWRRAGGGHRRHGRADAAPGCDRCRIRGRTPAPAAAVVDRHAFHRRAGAKPVS